MFCRRVFSVLFPLVALTPLASAQIGADECANADAIQGLGSFAFDTNSPSDTGVPATTGLEGGCALMTNDVWIEWTPSPALDGHIVQFDTCGASFNTEISVWLGTDCSAQQSARCNETTTLCSPGSAVEITAFVGETYRLQIGDREFVGLEWGTGTLTITDLGPDPCVGAADDGFEDNDECGSAVAIGAGTYTGLVVTRADSDFYRITVPPGQRLTVNGDSTTTFDATFDLRFYLTDATCQTQLSVGNGSPNTVVYWNSAATPVDVVLEARLWPFFVYPLCANYEFEVSFVPEPCEGPADDGLEPNDTCASAVPLPDGFFPGMLVTRTDSDYFRFEVEAQTLVEIELDFETELGNIDMILYRDFQCGTAGSEARSQNNSDGETIRFFNQANERRSYILVVYVRQSANDDLNCNTYDMRVLGTVPAEGRAYCVAAPNSIGVGATTEVLGSPVVSAQDVFLRTSGLPAGVPGLYFFGPQQIQVPFGDGLRCVGGMTQRVQPPAIAMGGAPSIAQRAVDFGAPYAVTIVAGADLNFQFWYRDPMAGMAGFNLSDGYQTAFR